MSETIDKVQKLVGARAVRISEHGYDELAADDLSVREIMAGVAAAQVVEDYPEFPKGPAMLVLQEDSEANPVHVVWGIPKGHQSPAVLVTAYRPDPARWDASFTERVS